MTPLRSPDPDIDGFQLPEHDASRFEWERAFARLNSVKLTLDQMERGYKASFVRGSDGYSHGPDILALRAFCEEERLLPADVAAEAILARLSAVLDAAFNGIDVYEGPQPYINLALRKLEVGTDVLQFVGTKPWVGGEAD